MKRLWVFGAITLATGCSSGDRAWMPLALGNQWDYTVRSGFTSQVEHVKVARETSVGSQVGVVIQGPMGTSTLSWKGATLLAAELPGSRFIPPIPILDVKQDQVRWSGTVRSAFADQSAVASLHKVDEDFRVGGVKTASLKSTLQIHFGGKNRELLTWFVSGVGIVRQEERHDGELVRTIEYVSGP